MNDQALVSNPFQPPAIKDVNNAVANSDSERAIQEVQAALVIAKKFPRDTVAAMDRILNACTRPTLANTALYSYPRGGQEVTGPSIRLAEALAQQWGNIQFGIRELSASNGVSSVEAFAWDVESNTRQVKTFQVTHERHTKKDGVRKLTDPRDIYELIANQGARRMRSCILAVIPGDVTEAAANQCAITQSNSLSVTPELLKQWESAFDKLGVPQELLEKKFGKRLEAFNAPQVVNLNKIYQSIKDGMSKPSDWFDIHEEEQTAAPKVSDISIKPAEKKTRGRPKNETVEETSEAQDPEVTATAEGIFGNAPDSA